MDPLNTAERLYASQRWPTLSAMFQALHSTMPPEVTALYEPKRITSPGGYHSVKAVASGLNMMIGETIAKYAIGEPIVPLQVTATAICYGVVKERVPIFFVTDKFIRAVAATSLPKDLRIEELKWPRPSLVFGFPVKFMQEYMGMDTCYVYASQQNKGSAAPCPFPGAAPAIEATRDKVSWMWYTWVDGHVENFASSYWNESLAATVADDFNYVDWTGAGTAVVEKNKAATDKISLLMLKLLCVLNWRDGLIEQGSISRPASIKRGIKRDELWSPNLIGDKYKTNTERAGGTHASPRVHYRSGHWRYAAMGSKDDIVPVGSLPRTDGYINWDQVPEETKQAFWRTHIRRWIEPVLVGIQI